jgi:hypothetical protein
MKLIIVPNQSMQLYLLYDLTGKWLFSVDIKNDIIGDMINNMLPTETIDDTNQIRKYVVSTDKVNTLLMMHITQLENQLSEIAY